MIETCTYKNQSNYNNFDLIGLLSKCNAELKNSLCLYIRTFWEEGSSRKSDTYQKKTVWPQSPSSTFVYSRDSLVPLLTTMEWTYVPDIQSQHWQHKSPQPLSRDTLWRIKSVHRYRNSVGNDTPHVRFFFHINRVPFFGRKKSLWRNQKWRSEYCWRTRPCHLRPPDWFVSQFLIWDSHCHVRNIDSSLAPHTAWIQE